MENKLTKREIQLREEAESNNWLWESIQERASLDWGTLTNLGRKQAKNLLRQWAEEVANEF